MTAALIIIIILTAVAAALALLYLHTRTQSQSAAWLRQDIEALRSDFKNSLNHLITQVNERLKDNTSVLGERLDNTVRVVGSVSEHLGRIHEASTKIFEIGKDISSLQELLRTPKIRGGVGEFFLEDLLRQVMPNTDFYQVQYRFKSGHQVDAVIKVGRDRFVPIDAKFPLENFKAMLSLPSEEEKKAARKLFISDVKKHITDISAKYILPDEGTFDFALMYIPAENVYYETIIKDEKFTEGSSIFNYSLSKKVIPVSPNCFYAYLQVILMGLKGMAVEKGTQQILANLDRLKGDFERFSEDFSKLGKHITNSKGCFEETEKRLSRIQEKIQRLSGLKEEKQLTDEQKITI
ncbi:MAG: DNA recombination protein RmuC [Candidatus Omnitrophica bacterium]|nr:DNA recombination protein RmuC [Candidatus Omnitrophota bacterium]